MRRIGADELREFGRRLRAARAYADGISTTRAAQLLGTSRSTLERWEAGAVSDDPPKRLGLAIGMGTIAQLDPGAWFGDDYRLAGSFLVSETERVRASQEVDAAHDGVVDDAVRVPPTPSGKAPGRSAARQTRQAGD